MADWFVQQDEYTELYHEYFSEFPSSVDVSGMIDGAYTLIAPYVERAPTKFCTYEEFVKGVEALRAFCELRRGQLDGSIPTTDDGQSADSSALIDASSLTLSDMGSMNRGGGGFGGRFGRTPDGQERQTNSPPRGRQTGRLPMERRTDRPQTTIRNNPKHAGAVSGNETAPDLLIVARNQ